MRKRARAATVLLVALVIGLLGQIGAGGAAGADVTAARKAKFRLTSPAFAEGATIPEGFTCVGANASPPLHWKGVPKQTVQLALIVDDPDAGIGTFVHWVAWNIAPKPAQLPEQTIPAEVLQGANGAGRAAYTGPCPPAGSGVHHYRFNLYALSKAPAVDPGTGTNAGALRRAVKGSVLAKTRLVGTFERSGNAG